MHASSVVLLAMLTSALTAVGTVYVVERYHILPEPAAEPTGTLVPELKGLSESDARKNAEAVQVALLVAGREASDQQKEGTVLRQSIPAGQRVPENHPVSVVLAEEVLKVPEVTRLAVAEATLLLKAKGYELKATESVPSADVEYGHIVEQHPAPGSVLKKGEAVTVKTSSGEKQVQVPELTGMSHNQAKETLDKLGLETKFSWVALPETVSYRVIRQTPLAGEKLKPGASVQLVVNR